MKYRSGLAGFFAAAWLALACGPTGASPVTFQDPPATPGLEMTRDILAETRLYCLALAVYFEGGSTVETEEGQRYIARVVAERARADRRKWGGADICDVVFHRRGGVCQFSFACLPVVRRTPKGGPAWRFSLAIARDELEQKSSVQERLIRYYMNPALTPDRNACRFRKEFVPVLEAGRHQFFREPSAAELAALAKDEPVECKRAAEALEAKKRLALAKKRIALQAKKRLAELLSKRRTAKAKNNGKGKKLKYARR